MRRKVLVLDDDIDINNYIKMVLIKEDYQVETTTNFNDFFKCFKRNKPDVCLVDLNLESAEGAGFNILKAIRNKYGNEINVIIISRRFSEEDIQYALKNGANDYVTKPLDDMILISKVNSCFGDMFKESSALPFYAVATTNRDAHLEMPFKVLSLHEDCILILSEQFIAKGNLVKVIGDIADKISPKEDLITTISEIKKCVELEGYKIKLSFNVEDIKIIKKVRQVLLSIN
jgi:CheY-like chemotaxis protein